MAGPIISDHKGNDRLWPHATNTPTLRALERSFRHSIESASRLGNRAGELAQSGKLTQAGVRDAVRQYAKSDLAPGIARGEAAINRAKAYVKETWSRLTPKARGNIDPVKRAHIYDKLSSLPAERRNAYLSKFADQLDADILFVALEMPSFPWDNDSEHFIAPATRETLTRRLIAAEHPQAMQEVTAINEAIEYASPTILKARQEMSAELGVTAPEWEAMAKSAAAQIEPIWLKRDPSGMLFVRSRSRLQKPETL